MQPNNETCNMREKKYIENVTLLKPSVAIKMNSSIKTKEEREWPDTGDN